MRTTTYDWEKLWKYAKEDCRSMTLGEFAASQGMTRSAVVNALATMSAKLQQPVPRFLDADGSALVVVGTADGGRRVNLNGNRLPKSWAKGTLIQVEQRGETVVLSRKCKAKVRP